MHLPPEVERLVPQLVGRMAGPGEIDPAEEAERIETLLLDRNPDRWLAYLRDRGELVETAAAAGGPADPADLTTLAAILRDQLALIQVSVDLAAEDLELLARLEELE